MVSFRRNKSIKAEHWLTYIKQNAKHSHSVESNTTENSKIMNNRFRRDCSTRFECCRPNGVSSQSTGIAEAVDSTPHEEAEGAFNSKDRQTQ